MLTVCLMAGLGLSFSGPVLGGAYGQVQSRALPDADLWTVSFLSADETPLPASSWAASDSADLLALTRTARTRLLSPAEQVLMRRLVLSSAAAPDSVRSDALLAERARIMFQIGEASAASQLLPTLNVKPIDLDTEEIAVDLQLAIGQTEAACLGGAGEGQEGAFWVKLRAVCFALDDNFEEAELAMELAGAQGVNDAWLSRAIFAASGVLTTKPEARFDSGLSLAISAKSALEPSGRTIANSRLDLAAAIARQDTFSPAMRVQAAGVAAEAGLLAASEHRALYKALIESEGFSPRTPLEVALKTTLETGNSQGAKARAVRAALRTARGNPARYAAVSRLLLADIKALSPSEQTSRMVLDFTYASLAAEAPDEALRWGQGSGEAAGDPFERVWMTGIMVLGSADADKETSGEAMTALIEAAKTNKQKAAASRVLILSHAMGVVLPVEARTFLARSPAPRAQNARQGISPHLRASISAAAKDGAAAEVILRALALIKGDAYKLSSADAASLVTALRDLGQHDAARLLALEATGYWRSSL